jgi:bifunctional non-homologous end joining protein LigD
MSFISPQLLTAAREAPEGNGWLHEVKFDGYRLAAHVEGGHVRLYTRGGHDWTQRLRPVEAAVAALELRSGYLDGELVAVAADGLPDFDALQRAMRGGRNAPRLLYHVFDVLRAGGRDLLHVELAERKRILAELVGADGDGTLRYVEHHVGSGPALHARAHALGIEGIVSKRVRSGYRPGVRTRAWVKVKCYRVYRVTVARVRDGEVAVLDGDGAPAGWVPVYSRLQLAALRPGTEVTVKALARRPGRHLRHATIVDEATEIDRQTRRDAA